MRQSCDTCDAGLVPDTAPAPAANTESAHGTVSGTLDGPRAWMCPNGHERRSADLAAARAEVTSSLTVARRTRIKGTLRCGRCDAALIMPGRRATRSVTLTTTGLPATRLTFDIPVLRCTEDAAENLPPECVHDLYVVVDELLAPAQVHP